MAFIDNIKLAVDEWNFITDTPQCLLQFKLDRSIVVYWYEDDADPTSTHPSPDMHDDVGILNDGQTNGVGKLDKVYTNTQGGLWVYPTGKISVLIQEEIE